PPSGGPITRAASASPLLHLQVVTNRGARQRPQSAALSGSHNEGPRLCRGICYCDDSGHPMVGSRLVRDPKFTSRVVAETRAFLSTTQSKSSEAQLGLRPTSDEQAQLNRSKKMTTKIAIVTGGSRGIGRNTVESLARRGVHSIFTYHSHSADAEAVVAEVENAGAKAVALKLDTGDIASFDAFVDSVKDALGKLEATHFDFLVNNAGNNHRNMPFAEATEEELDSAYNVHFKGVLFLTQKLLPLINDGGRINNISTGRARISTPGGSVYASMKGAVEVLSRHMALELGPRRIAVNIVAPGAVATDFSGGVVRDNPAVNKRIADNTALGRVGLPDDLGPVIADLLSADFRFVNGQRIEV